VQNNFGVAIGAGPMAYPLQFKPQFLIVVGFSIVNQVNGMIFIAERLLSTGQVNNAQPATAQATSPGGRKVNSTLVRAAVDEGANLGVQIAPVYRLIVLGINACNATHFDIGF
jgi:hypothetical protein